MLPNSQRLNRGGYKLSEIVDTCRRSDFTDMVIVQEHRGEPDGLVVTHLPYGPTASFTMVNTVMRHDIEGRGTVSEAYPHLVFDNFTSGLGERVMSILRFLYPVPKVDSKRVMSFVNRDDFISFRHHVVVKNDGHGQVEIEEVGPRFELQLYEIKLGTADQEDVEREWIRHSYTNSAKKRRVLTKKV